MLYAAHLRHLSPLTKCACVISRNNAGNNLCCMLVHRYQPCNRWYGSLSRSSRHKVFDHSGSKSYSNHFFLLQVFPGSLLPHNYPDPQNPDHLSARSEVERRRDYIQPLYGQLGEEHPLVQLVCQCLHNIPARRPTAKDLLQRLQAVKAQIEGPYVKVDMEMVRVLREKNTEIKHLQQQFEVGLPCTVHMYWIC